MMYAVFRLDPRAPRGRVSLAVIESQGNKPALALSRAVAALRMPAERLLVMNLAKATRPERKALEMRLPEIQADGRVRQRVLPTGGRIDLDFLLVAIRGNALVVRDTITGQRASWPVGGGDSSRRG